MTLLLDANLSHRLLSGLADRFPGSRHVRQLGLMHADDTELWRYARANRLAIVTLDSDFYDMGLVHGWPPKVVWLRSLDTSTESLRQLMQERLDQIAMFLRDPLSACLMMRR